LSHWVGFLNYLAPLSRYGVFVGMAHFGISDKSSPYARRTNGLQLICSVYIAIEISNDVNCIGVWRPNGKPAATGWFGVRTEAFPQTPMRSLVKQMLV
jgi:hypothetical protein